MRFVHLIRSLAAGLACAAGLVGMAAANDLTAIRFGDHDDYSRVVIESDQPISFETFTLAEPSPRLIVSLPGASWRVGNLANARGEGFGLFGSFRFEPDGVTPRLVFTLDGPAEVQRQMTLDPDGGGYRIVIDVVPSQPERFVASAGFPDSSRTLTELLAQHADVSADIGLCQRPRIVIDPGHGGRDPGAVARFGGDHESAVNLAAALTLRDLLNATGRFDVVLTRETDVFIELEDRVRIARAAEADMFISLHSDAAENSSARGASVFTLSQSGVDRSRVRAGRGGDWFLSDSNRAPEVDEILFNIAIGDKLLRSRQFASTLLRETSSVTQLLHATPGERGFLVLLDAQFPAVLFEMGFISNRQDANNLNDPAFRQRLMQTLVRALEQQFPACQPRDGGVSYASLSGEITRTASR